MVQGEMSFKKNSYLELWQLSCLEDWTIYAILVKGIIGNIVCEIL